MKTEAIEIKDIDILNELQPEGWGDIRPYFYYYSASEYCNPIKITDGEQITAVGTTIQHQDTAWLAHIIVHPGFRNQGLGKELTRALMGSLDPDIFQTIYLDATDLGYPVYKKLGFEIETEYIHLDGEYADLHLRSPGSVIPFHEKYRTEVLELDKSTSGENRTAILNEYLKTSLLYLSDGKVRGAYFPGFFDRYIMAADPEAGTELMKLRMRSKITARLPVGNESAINFLIENGYKKVRTSRKMRLGKQLEWKAENIYNRISGGLG